MKDPAKQRNIARQTFEPLDAIDRQIVGALQRDPRLRVTELGRAVGLSAPAASERLARLEDSGVLSFRAEVNPHALGYTVHAILRVSPQSRKIHLIPDIARSIPEVTECYRVTGDDCYVIRLYLRSIEELTSVLDRFTPHGRTTTSIVNAVPIPPRSLSLEEQV